MSEAKGSLAILGGPKEITQDHGELFSWPPVNQEDEDAVLDVLRRGAMSGTDITKAFESEFAAWLGVKHALAYNNGTEALRGAMWACGVGAGDEIICPSMTYWASAAPALSLGAAINFADINPQTLCIDHSDIEHRIGPRTRLIVVVHYAGHPAEMDEILRIARKHGVKVLEDASHAHGALYKGRKCGTMGDVAAFSMMSGKSFAIGEGGMLATNDRLLWERAIAYGHYERTGGFTRWGGKESCITDPSLAPFAGVPLGGFKHRINQMCSALGRVQLKYFDQRMAEIQRAMERFWSLMAGVPGVRPHMISKAEGSTMGGWYNAHGLYVAEELGGLPCAKFCEAVSAEGVYCRAGANRPLHLNRVFHDADIFNQGRPTMISFGQRDVRQGAGALPVSERISEICFGVPWFKHDNPEVIAQYAAAYRKVAENAGALLFR